eukprot:7379052-Prymnesium_polylepis.2
MKAPPRRGVAVGAGPGGLGSRAITEVREDRSVRSRERHVMVMRPFRVCATSHDPLKGTRLDCINL